MSIQEYNKILKDHFGYDSLKPEQYEIISKLINDKKDVCAILATGFGKSICFQMPYLITQKCVVVISPLIALMEDQMKHMENLDIPVCCLNSNCKNKSAVKKDLLNGNHKLIYITPEYVQHCEEFLTELYEEDKISLIAIDESHCVSTYGNDFRPTYKELGCLRKWLPDVPILAVTATASDKVRKDIIKFLELNKPHMIVGNFDRPNLYIRVDEVTYSNKKLDVKMIELLKRYEKEYIIIYCKTREDTERVAELVSSLGIKCGAYHAGLSAKIRNDIQQDFIESKIKCIVATIAFGMGINIAQVRLVIHYGCPKNLESYYQEIGRAGRDGKPSECHLFYSKRDFALNRFLLKSIDNPTHRAYQEEQIRVIEKYVYTKECRRKLLLANFGGKIESCTNCDNCTSLKNMKVSKVDCTYQAFLFMSVINKLDNTYGGSTLINILRGSNAKNITANMKKMKEYNAGKEYSSKWWELLIRDLINHNFIIKKAFKRASFGSVITLTKDGENWLTNLNTKYPKYSETSTIDEDLKFFMSVENSVKVSIAEPKDDIEMALDIMNIIDKDEKDKLNDNKVNSKQKPESKPESAGKKWSIDEDSDLLEEIKKKSIRDIAHEHNRTAGAINARLKKIACDMYEKSKKTEKDLEEISKKTKISRELILKTMNNKQLYVIKEEVKELKEFEEEDELIRQMEEDLRKMEEDEKKKNKVNKKK